MRLLTGLSMIGALVSGQVSSGTISDDSPLVILYYENWAGWVREFSPSNVAESILSKNMPVRNWVINYSFYTWNPTECSIQPVDTVDLQKGDHGGWTSDDWTINETESWATSKPVGGHLPAFMGLKAQYPYIKLLPSIGGWSRSGTYHDCLINKADAMVQSIRDFVTVWGWDGVDFDWEYPNCDGGPCGCQGEAVCPPGKNLDNVAGSGDWDRYTAFVQKVRAAFTELEPQLGRKLYITAALGLNPKLIDGGNETWSVGTPVEWICDNDYFDWVNLMAYDFYGPWAPTTGPLAPLYENTETSAAQMSIHESVQKIIARCSKPYKLTMGLATYGKAWSNTPKAGTVPGLWQEATGSPLTAGGTWELGTLSYFDIKKNVLPACTRTWDDVSKTPTLYCDTMPAAQDIPYDPNTGAVQRGQSNVFITYEDAESWKYKMQYARVNGMAGAIIWAASDVGNGKSYAPDSTADLYKGLFQGWFGDDTITIAASGTKGSAPSFGPRWENYPCPLSIDYVKDGNTIATDRCTGATYSPAQKYLTVSGTQVSDVGKDKIMIHPYSSNPTLPPSDNHNTPGTGNNDNNNTESNGNNSSSSSSAAIVCPPVVDPNTTVPNTPAPVVPDTTVPNTPAPVVPDTTVPNTPAPVDPNTPAPSGGAAEWDASKTYDTPCTAVSHNGQVWYNGWWTQGEEPGTNDVWRAKGGHYQC